MGQTVWRHEIQQVSDSGHHRRSGGADLYGRAQCHHRILLYLSDGKPGAAAPVHHAAALPYDGRQLLLPVFCPVDGLQGQGNLLGLYSLRGSVYDGIPDRWDDQSDAVFHPERRYAFLHRCGLCPEQRCDLRYGGLYGVPDRSARGGLHLVLCFLLWQGGQCRGHFSDTSDLGPYRLCAQRDTVSPGHHRHYELHVLHSGGAGPAYRRGLLRL